MTKDAAADISGAKVERICPHFHVSKRTLLAVAGAVWLVAGINVAHLGVEAYGQLSAVTLLLGVLSLVVFAIFGTMFFKMSMKHTQRIKGFVQKTRPIWHFFDTKSYIIMAIMMSGGITLRNSGVLPTEFIAVFYTGLGIALALAGVVFLVQCMRFTQA